MLFPISDDNSDRHITPFITWGLIALNIFVFVFLQGLGSNIGFTYAFSTVPAEILTNNDLITEGKLIRDMASGQTFQVPGLQPTPIPVYLTLITSMFMHGGIAHIAGNMLYLWIFGDNLENRLGHGRYLLFYLLTGIIASLSHVLFTQFAGADPMIPSLGASGAISGVMGGYLLLYPNRRVNALVGWFIIAIPSWIALGMWIGLQLVSGFGSLSGQSDGVAYAAHIGGFAAGFLLIKFFDRGKPVPPKQTQQQWIYRRR
ncbi:rhomboid family intramembrane serine protease [Flavihumibacter sp. RY-1]|jgi:membrane associated rhomboid family serine protease|uniref:Rhomboid family intramembrane serine protease n=1 Tax=Flavihumibacter fluminis TaxID=2909236 RepID=A0ABS9BKE7_9BACT|nr:rhomboid family intramembrane serine protease [Flavihumibacter fluminis]MBU7577002.1 rhomboid family intramembrane serine protease [Flavihumibacter sp.]MCF1716075.1 rhomboid family intramembrane serine protease [Flavihumibacter fluminis]